MAGQRKVHSDLSDRREVRCRRSRPPREGPGLEFHTRTVVTRVRLDAEGNVSGAVYRTWAKSQDDHSLGAKHVVLAGNSIETPRLWLNSKLENGRDLWPGV